MEYLTVKQVIDRGDVPNYGRPVFIKLKTGAFEKIGGFKYEIEGAVNVFGDTGDRKKLNEFTNYYSNMVYFKTRKKSKDGNIKKD